MSTIFSCKNCQDRYPGCHSHCEKYQKEKAEHDKRKSEIYKEKFISYYTIGSICRKKNAAAIHKKGNRRYSRNGRYD